MRDNWKRAMLFQYFNSITKLIVVPASWIFDTVEMYTYTRKHKERENAYRADTKFYTRTSVPRSCDVDARVKLI